MTPEQILIAIVCYIGVIAGAALPYYRKKEIAVWDHKYTWVVVVACTMSAITLESTVLEYARNVVFGDAILMPLFMAFMAGFGFVTGTSEAMKLLEGLKARWLPAKE